MAALHDGANQEARLSAARATLQNPRSSENTVGFGDHTAMRADKAVRPAGPLEMGSARRVIRKLLLKFGVPPFEYRRCGVSRRRFVRLCLKSRRISQ